MGHYDFTKDLEDGKQGELRFAERCQRWRPGIRFLEQNDDKRFDWTAVLYERTMFTIEVKADDWSIRTGNLAFEYESRGKASGISTTQATIHAHQYGEAFLIFEVSTLRDELANIPKRTPWIKSVGDRGSNTWVYLIPVSTARQWSLCTI